MAGTLTRHFQRLTSNEVPKGQRELWAHLSGTYFTLRMTLAVTALLMPVVLLFWGMYGHGLEIQPSMSRYFWAATKLDCASFPMRTFLVAALLVVSVCLFVHKGFTPLENVLLKVAAILNALIAFFPEGLPTLPTEISARDTALYATCPAIKEWAFGQQSALHVHTWAALVTYGCLFLVVLKCARKSLDYLPDAASMKKETFVLLYRLIAWAMPLAGFGIATLGQLGNDAIPVVFMIEATETWLFSAYWWVKTYELQQSTLRTFPAG